MDGTLGSAKVASLGKAWDHFSHYRVSDVETSWDVEPFAAGLQCLHLDTPLLEQLNINTKKRMRLKTVCMCSWNKCWTQRDKKKKNKKNPTATSEKPGAKARAEEQRQSAARAPRTQGT